MMAILYCFFQISPSVVWITVIVQMMSSAAGRMARVMKVMMECARQSLRSVQSQRRERRIMIPSVHVMEKRAVTIARLALMERMLITRESVPVIRDHEDAVEVCFFCTELSI